VVAGYTTYRQDPFLEPKKIDAVAAFKISLEALETQHQRYRIKPDPSFKNTFSSPTYPQILFQVSYLLLH